MVETHTPPSFIPQDTGSLYASRRKEGGGLGELLVLSAIVLFVASLALGGGVFLYDQYLLQESARKEAMIKKNEESFQPALIREITRLDERIKSSERILSTHVAPTAIFAALQQTTLQTISFRTLNLEITDTQHISMQMAGVAQSVNSIALQADTFSKTGVINSPIFSGITRDKGGVNFKLAATVNPSFINYQNLVGKAAAQTVQPVQAVPETPATPFTSPGASSTSPATTQ